MKYKVNELDCKHELIKASYLNNTSILECTCLICGKKFYNGSKEVQIKLDDRMVYADNEYLTDAKFMIIDSAIKYLLDIYEKNEDIDFVNIFGKLNNDIDSLSNNIMSVTDYKPKVKIKKK